MIPNKISNTAQLYSIRRLPFIWLCALGCRSSKGATPASNFGDAFDLSYPRICEDLGVEAGVIDTPETGAGKDCQDADFGTVRHAITVGVNAGLDAISSATTSRIVESFSGAAQGKVNRIATIKRGLGPADLKRFITGKVYRWVYEFEYGKYIGSWMHRYAGLQTKGRFYSRDEIDKR
jgi:hypothetical protein